VTAVVGVVIIHAVRPLGLTWSVPGWQVATALDLAFVWSVPVFVMISGALVLDPAAHAQGPGAFYRRRFARILPALVAWHVIYLLFVRQAVEANPVSLVELRTMAVDGDFYGALWFLWVIVGLYLVAPILAAFLARNRRRILITGWATSGYTAAVFALIGAAQIWGSATFESPTILTQWWPYVGLFVLGLGYRDRMPRPAAVVALAGAGTGLLVLVIWQVIAMPNETFAQLGQVAYHGAVVTVASVCVFIVGNTIGTRMFSGARSQGATADVLRLLAEAAFGVFLCHQLILALLVRYVLPTMSLTNSLLLAALTLVGAFAVSVTARQVPGLRRIF
jgi:surface polysaccharide O-acyltransferase-like enzyme